MADTPSWYTGLVHPVSRGTWDASSEAQTRLFKRGGTFYYRQKIPRDLDGRFGRRREIKVSLKTDSLKLARNLALEKTVEWNREFDRVRTAGLGSISLDVVGPLPREPLIFLRAQESGRTVEVREIDEHFITQVCRTYVRVGLNDDAEWRTSPNFDRGLCFHVCRDTSA